LTSLTVCDTLDGTNYAEKGSDVNRPLGVIRRLGLGTALAGAAIWVVVLGSAVPAQAAVDLVYFEATGYDDHVLIEWGTPQELNNVGFNLYRTETPDFNDSSKGDLGFIPAQHPGQIEGADYSYTDSDIEAGTTYTYYYWLEDVDFGGVPKRHGPVSASTPSETPTSTPTATATSTPTRVPTATPTTVLTATPSSTATVVPTSTPAGTLTATAVSPPSSSPSPTAVVEQGLSPTATPGGIAQPTLSPAAGATEWMPTPTSTTVAWGGDSQPGAPGWSSFLVHWPTIHPSTILLLISLVSLLGVLLLSVALALVRKLSL
jgi:hypothetical protein